MENLVIELLAYGLVDALAMPMTVQKTAPRLAGNTTQVIPVDGVEVSLKARVVSAQINQKNHMVLVRVVGNLALLAVASYASTNATKTYLQIMVVDLAKLGSNGDGWLELHTPVDAAQAEVLLGEAVVAKFDRMGNQALVAA